MAFEIEAKARIPDPAQLDRIRRELDLLGFHGGAFFKQDTYYAPEGASGCDDSLIRLRFEEGGGDSALVTRKEKRLAGAVEVNRELEFTVSPPKPFEKMLGSLGYSYYIEKTKRGDFWDLDNGSRAELCEVTGLGWFLEIELVFPEGDGPAPDEKELTANLMHIFHQCGIDEAALEKAYYIDLLLEERNRANE